MYVVAGCRRRHKPGRRASLLLARTPQLSRQSVRLLHLPATLSIGRSRPTWNQVCVHCVSRLSVWCSGEQYWRSSLSGPPLSGSPATVVVRHLVVRHQQPVCHVVVRHQLVVHHLVIRHSIGVQYGGRRLLAQSTAGVLGRLARWTEVLMTKVTGTAKFPSVFPYYKRCKGL